MTCTGCGFLLTSTWTDKTGEEPYTPVVEEAGVGQSLTGIQIPPSFEIENAGPDGESNGSCKEVEGACVQDTACDGDFQFTLKTLAVGWTFDHISQSREPLGDGPNPEPSPTTLLEFMEEGESYTATMLDAECGYRTTHTFKITNALDQEAGTLVIFLDCKECVGGEEI